MNQSKLEVVKQETARVNINILGISELKWTGMGKFNSDGHYIYYSGQKSLRRNGVALIVKKRAWNAVLGCNLINDRMILIHFKGKTIQHQIIQVYAPTTDAKKAEVEWFCEGLQDLKPIPKKKKKRCPFHHRELEWKSRKSRDTWSNRQVSPWSTKWSRANANRVLLKNKTNKKKHNTLVIANTLSINTRDSSTHGHHRMVNT